MRLVFLGSGDAFGSGGRFNTCMLLETAARRILIDCGASSLIAIKRAAIDPDSIDAIVVSHLHGDHFGGLPFVILDAQFARRTAPLTIAGPPGLKERLRAAMEIFFPGSSTTVQKFDLQVTELAVGQPNDVVGLTVTPFLVNHACGSPPLALRVEADQRTVTYSGDTEWTDALIDAARDADLFVCEAYGFDRRIRFHMDLATLEQKLDAIRAKRLILTHMGPDMLARLGEVRHETAEDGMIVEL